MQGTVTTHQFQQQGQKPKHRQPPIPNLRHWSHAPGRTLLGINLDALFGLYHIREEFTGRVQRI